jgi:hypothetical protein
MWSTGGNATCEFGRMRMGSVWKYMKANKAPSFAKRGVGVLALISMSSSPDMRFHYANSLVSYWCFDRSCGCPANAENPAILD